MRRYLVIAVLVLLSGCATLAGTGYYRYTYTDPVTGEKCEVLAATRRDAGGPNTVNVKKGCVLEVETGSLTGGQVDVEGVSRGIAEGVARVLNRRQQQLDEIEIAPSEPEN